MQNFVTSLFRLTLLPFTAVAWMVTGYEDPFQDIDPLLPEEPSWRS